jgi:hypothetical protein
MAAVRPLRRHEVSDSGVGSLSAAETGGGGGPWGAAAESEGPQQDDRPRAGRRYSSQSLSLSFLGRYSSVMKLIPRRESASSSNFWPLRTISWISRCQRACLNQG